MASIQSKCQNCGNLVRFEDAWAGQRRACPSCKEETLLVRLMTPSRIIGESLLALVSVPVGLLYFFYLVTLPFTTYSIEAFLDSPSVGGLYVLSIAGVVQPQLLKHESPLMRVSLSVWCSILGGLMGVIMGLITSILVYWPVWVFKKMFMS